MFDVLLSAAGDFLATYWILVLVIGFGMDGIRRFAFPSFWQSEPGKALSYFAPLILGALAAIIPGISTEPALAQKMVHGLGVGIFVAWAFPALKKGLLRPLLYPAPKDEMLIK